MALVFVTRELPGTAVGRLAIEHTVNVWPGPKAPERAQLLAAAGTVEGLLCMLAEKIDAELLDAAPKLRAIANLAVGTDNIDLAECERRGIAVGNTPDVLVEATADLTFGLLLAAARGIAKANADVRAGRWRTWEPRGWLGHAVAGGTLGIVGPGSIGRAVARRAAGFGMEVIASGRDGEDPPSPLREAFYLGGSRFEIEIPMVPLKRLLERSDFISLHCPLSEATRRLIGREQLDAMKETAILINTARGEVIDPDALREALMGGAIAGAALDVTDPEPLPATHPLLEAPNLLVTPHIGSATHRAREAMVDLAVENLREALAGRPMPNGVRNDR